MQLTYDDEEKSFSFELDDPVHDDNIVEFEMFMEEGLSGFPRAYSLSKHFETILGSFVDSLYAATVDITLEPVRKNIRDAIKDAGDVNDFVQQEFDKGEMDAETYELMTKTAKIAIEAGNRYLVIDLESILNTVFLESININGNQGVANFSLPDLTEPVFWVSFTLDMLSDEMLEIDRAMLEKDKAGLLH